MSNSVPVLSTAKRLLAQGELDQAERLFRRVLEDDPVNLTAARSLVSLLLDQKRGAEASKILAHVLRARPTDGELLALWGRGLFTAGRLQEATLTLERALGLSPGSYTARLWLAHCRTASYRAIEAVKLLTPMLSTHGRDRHVRDTLGHAYLALTRGEQALAQFRIVVEVDPSAGSYSDLGWALQMVGRFDEAIEAFERALALKPGDPLALAGKAAALAGRGDFEQARATAQEGIEAGSRQPTLLANYARLARAPEHRAIAQRAIGECLAKMTLTPVNRCSMLMSLGTLQEADGNYDAAFESFRTARDPDASGFDLRIYQRSCRKYAEVFNPETIRRVPRSTINNELPVFIVGMPRSGTSLVEQILASHPAVHGAGELNDLTNLAAGMAGNMKHPGKSEYPDCVRDLTQEDVDSLAAGYLARLRKLGPEAQRVTDKMPQNYVFLGLIDILFPGARVIHCMRDPLDTCISCFTTPLNQGHPYCASLALLAGVYREYRTLMAHWRRASLRIPVLDVRYEDLVADPEPQCRRLLEFIGLPWDDRCLRFYETPRAVHTASIDQVRKPLYSSSVGRWKRYEKHLGELIESLKGVD